MMIARVVVGAGSSRRVFALDPARDARRSAASDIKRFLFPSDGSYHKAKRRGDRALSVA